HDQHLERLFQADEHFIGFLPQVVVNLLQIPWFHDRLLVYLRRPLSSQAAACWASVTISPSPTSVARSRVSSRASAAVSTSGRKRASSATYSSSGSAGFRR